MLGRVNKMRFKHIYSTFQTEHIIANTPKFNPITAPTFKKFGLKDARTSLQTVHFLALVHIYFRSYAFWWFQNPFPCQVRSCCLNVLGCRLTYEGQAETNAWAWLNKSLRPRKPEGSLGRTAQDGHLDSHTAPELRHMPVRKRRQKGWRVSNFVLLTVVFK